MSLEDERRESGERITEIMEEIMCLVDEALDEVRSVGTPQEIARARTGWLGHIRKVLNDEYGGLPDGGCTMEDTARELMAEEEGEEGEEGEE